MFDIRLNVKVNEKEFEALLRKWCKEAGEGVTIEWDQKNPLIPVTKLDSTNPWWTTFKAVADEL